MPQLLEHIDAICRKKKRAVLLLRFKSLSEKVSSVDPEDWDPFDDHVDWENHPGRREVIAWFNQNEIPWTECGDIASEYCMTSYRGQIYVDVPYDKESEQYRKVEAFLENPDGTMRLPGVEFWALSFELAMKNAHHDEPGFWEKWAENF